MAAVRLLFIRSARAFLLIVKLPRFGCLPGADTLEGGSRHFFNEPLFCEEVVKVRTNVLTHVPYP